MIFPTLNIAVERWKFNEEFGIYVSNLGHFKDRQKRNLAYKINQKGYCMIKTEQGPNLAHRIVMLTWRPIPNRERMTVDHLNHNKRDNSLANLEWVTRRENMRRAERDLSFIEEEKTNGQEERKFLVNNCITLTENEFFNFLKSIKMPFNEEKFHKYATMCIKNEEFKCAGMTLKRI